MDENKFGWLFLISAFRGAIFFSRKELWIWDICSDTSRIPWQLLGCNARETRRAGWSMLCLAWSCCHCVALLGLGTHGCQAATRHLCCLIGPKTNPLKNRKGVEKANVTYSLPPVCRWSSSKVTSVLRAFLPILETRLWLSLGAAGHRSLEKNDASTRSWVSPWTWSPEKCPLSSGGMEELCSNSAKTRLISVRCNRVTGSGISCYILALSDLLFGWVMF